MKKYFLVLTFLPFFAKGDFSTSDSNNLDLLTGYTYNILQSVGLGGNGGSSSLLNHSSSIDTTSQNIYTLLSGDILLGSRAVYDFIGSSSTINFPAIDSLRVLSSTSPDSAPSYNLWSYQSQTAPDFKSFLHGFVNRQFPLMYSLSSGVSDLDARAWRLQNQGAYITNVLSHGIGDSWTYQVLPSPFSSAGVGWSFFDLNRNPTDAGNYLQSRFFASSPDLGSSIVNFEKWFIDDYATKRDFWDSLAVARANTFYNISSNHYGFVEAYDVALSNIVEGIRADNKKTSDFFSNLWVTTFQLPQPSGASLGYTYYSPRGSSYSSWPDSASPSQLTLVINPEQSFTSLLLSFLKQFMQVSSYNSKYLWSYLVQLQRLNSKIDSLPSAISSALSSVDVTIDNPTVHVTVDNASDISTTLDTSYQPVYGYDIADTGYIYSDINPDIDKGMPENTLLHSLTGDFFSDSIVVLQTLSKQHTTLNVAAISILTNVQVIADYLRGDEHSDPNYAYDKSSIEGTISSAEQSFINFGQFDELDTTYRFTTSLGFSENVYLPETIEVDFSSLYDMTYSFFKVREQVDVNDLVFEIDIAPYHWFFKLMRGASIVLIVIFNIQLYIFLGRVFLWLLSLVFRSIAGTSPQ